LERLLKATRAQAVFEVGQFYGARFGLPVISWIPDLQHRFMPEMFSRVNWWRRDLAFRMQIFSGRTLMVSSQTAHDDMERCYPRARGRGHVVRFAIDLDIAATLAGGGRARAAHGLPDRFLLLPNQFWRHKNHIVIVQALVRLKSDGALPATLPVVLSGSSLDVRSPGHFEDLMGTVRAAGVESHFRYLGLIPYEDVLSLAGCCDALINPSYFEGWSTTIEEAKALGAPLMLSDIPIHREQAPQASFFAPGSSDAAAQILRQVSEQASPRRPLLTELLAAQARRLDEHARSLLAVVAAAANRGAR
jgi:glycosyltransferase involved in cell wall biosynthesis